MAGTIGRDINYGFLEKQSITPDGIETNFVLNHSVGKPEGLLVVQDGVVLEPGVEYFLSPDGTEIQFDVAPLVSAVVYLIYLGKEVLIPAVKGSKPILVQETASGGETFKDLAGDLPPGAELAQEALIVFQNNLMLRLTDDYTVSGTIVTFVSPLTASDQMDYYVHGIMRDDISELEGWKVDAATNLVPKSAGNYSVGTSTNPIKDLVANGNATIGGNLLVGGSIDYISTNVIPIGDSVIELLADHVGAPLAGSFGVEVNRGTSTNSSLKWNEGSDKWKAGILGLEENILLDPDFVYSNYGSKGSVDSTDLLLIEDSADSFNKKNITFSALVSSINVLPNDTYWSGKNFADTLTVPLIGVDISDNTAITSIGQIDLYTGYATQVLRWSITDTQLLPNANTTYDIGDGTHNVSTVFTSAVRMQGANLGLQSSAQVDVFTNGDYVNPKWRVDTTGDLLPYVTGAYDIGSATNQVQQIYAAYIKRNGGTQYVGVETAHPIIFFTNNADRWTIDGSSGDFDPATNATQSIGNTSAHVLSVYARALLSSGAEQFVGTASIHDLYLQTNNVSRWLVTTNGHLYPHLNNAYSVGGPSNHVSNIWSGQFINQSGGVMWFEQRSNSHIYFTTNNTARWFIENSGHIFPVHNDTYYIGGGANRVQGAYLRNVYNCDLLEGPAAGNLTVRTVNTLYLRGDVDTVIQTGATSRWYVSGSGHFSPWVGATYDIGLSSLPVRDIWALRITRSGGYVGIGPTTAHDVYIYSSNVVRWIFQSGGHLVPNSNGNYDIGNSGFRIRSAYLNGIQYCSDISHLGAMTIGPTVVSNLNLRTANGTRWVISGSGTYALYPGASDAYDIGGTGNRIREAYIRDVRYCDTLHGHPSGVLYLRSAASLFLGWGSLSGHRLQGSGNDFYPDADGSVNLGTSSLRFNGLNVIAIGQPSTVGNASVVYSDSYQSFTGHHLYEMGEDLDVGDAIRLENNKIVKCDIANDPRCIGLFQHEEDFSNHSLSMIVDSLKQELPKTARIGFVAAVGDTRTSQMQGFKVCDEGGSISYGDLLCTSSTPGFLMKWTPDINTLNCVVGKAAEDVTFDNNGQATGIYGFIYAG